ncbi:Disks large 5-like 1 [Homarus americanus]|uniref:Disks large 5-like 1 n=1 Tax=Homarus americanus TaxID=6706 RepID=A0A8J5JGC8_HOMAM|nr:Disks large 5-like 1 [Homarus americanus]
MERPYCGSGRPHSLWFLSVDISHAHSEGGSGSEEWCYHHKVVECGEAGGPVVWEHHALLAGEGTHPPAARHSHCESLAQPPTARARAARACSRLVEAGGRSYGRVAGVTRGASQHLGPPLNTAATNFRLLAKLPSKLPRPSLAAMKKRVSVSVRERGECVTPREDECPASTGSGPRDRLAAGAHLVSRGRSALQEKLQAAARAMRKPPRAALGVVRTAGQRHKWPPNPAPDPPPPAIVTTDRDIMKKELKKVTRERDEALGRLSVGGHHPDQPANYGTLPKGGGSLSDKGLLGSSRDYESLKMQCEKAMGDVQGLLKQNVDITRKYENTMKEVVAEKQKLEREVTSLQTIMEDDRKEIADLRRQQQEAITQEGSGEAINQLYMTTMRKYEAIKDEYDSIRKRYSDLVASHSNNISKLELTQEEVSRLKKQYDEILRECNEAVREKNCLKQQCTKAITEWDSALREKNKLQEELLKVREKYDEMMKEMNTHLIQRQHLNKDLKRLQEERNAAMQEYTLVMSERDTVHKEMDKLQEELSQASKKIKTIEQTTNDSSKEVILISL